MADWFDSRRSAVYGDGGMVATSQPAAVAAGLKLLQSGGNAADAAVATAAALAVTEPTSNGIGGDCFALYRDAATGEITALNASGRAPAAASAERVRGDVGDSLAPGHGHTITVPGAISGWVSLLERHGSRPLADCVAPAIRLATDGFPVAPVTAWMWHRAERLLQFAAGGDALLIAGRAPVVGERFVNRALADNLTAIARDGADAFYAGPMAEAIARAAQAAGGTLTAADLAAHRASWHPSISADFAGARVHECPPNGQGLTALLAMNILSAIGLGDGDPLGPDRLHRVIESLRLAFADARAAIADPDHVAVPVAKLLDPAYAAERARVFDPARAVVDPRAGSALASSDTVYLCVVDAAGNACSFIQSNYMGFGTGVVPDGCGFSLQNRGHNFSLDAAHPNCIAPGKRPYHTIIPGLLTRADDGALLAPFGVMGGFMQPQGHLQVALALLVDGADSQAALDRPRIRVDADGRPTVSLEEGIASATADALAAMGHAVHVVRGPARGEFGRGQIVWRDPDTGTLCGGSDPRGDGQVGTVWTFGLVD